MKFPNPEYLTHPNIPKPLHGVNPRSVLGKEWWDTHRQEAYAKNNYCCWACGVHKTEAKYHQWLEAHESYDFNYRLGRANLKEIIALCHSCHNFIHSGRLQMLVNKGEYSAEKQDDILRHGYSVLSEANLKPFDHGKPGKVARWGKWHIVIDGKKYYSKFKNIDEWAEYYRRYR